MAIRFDLPVSLDDVDLKSTKCIKAMVHFGRRHPRSPGYYREAGRALIRLRADKPKDLWARILRDVCGLGVSRAYQLMQIGAGETTLAQLRAETSARVKKTRKNKQVNRSRRGKKRHG